MKKEKIENYIEQLKKLDEQINVTGNPKKDISNAFINELNDVLTSLTQDIEFEMGKKVQETPMLDVGYKKLRPDAVEPTYAKDGDAGLDFTTTHQINNTKTQATYGTGIAIQIPKGYVGLLFPRSSVRDYELILANCVGVIDSGFRGEIEFTFNKTNGLDSFRYKPGDRIGQIVIIPFPKVKLRELKELTKTERNDGGYGHTGT